MTVSITHTTPADSSFSPQGATAWNASHSVTGLGTMATQDANTVAVTGGAIDGTPVGGTTPAAGTFTTLTATGQTSLGGVAGSESLRVIAGATNGSYSQVTGTAGYVEFRTLGTNSNNSLYFVSRGAGTIGFFTNNSTSNEQFRVSPTASAVNYVQVTGSATTKSPIFSVAGSDANISPVFQSKGTGAIDLAAGSSGVNISNGGTVTAITGTAAGSGYTSIPTVAVSAPTTAGGVTATATAAMTAATTAIANGGTGYTVGDVLTFVGGTFSSAVTCTVSTVSSGVITAVSFTSAGTYTALPTNPISVTGGTGTGATFNVNTWGVRTTAFTITNAGSGYVEQPTVTFSGGGGSGAAAYATVGSGTIVKSVGITTSFYTPSGEGFRIADSQVGTTTPSFFIVNGNNSNAFLTASGGSGSAVGVYYLSKGTGQHSFTTNAQTGTEQFRVSHTASAVNYVQVTGGASGTPGTVTISAQGSSANVNVALIPRGTGSVLVTGGNGLGYGTGTGGAVTQATSRTTGVTLDKSNGAITLVSAAGSATWQSFTVTNNTVAATDVVNVCQKSGADKYMLHVTAVAAGSFEITYATTGGTTTEQPVFNFAVLKAVTS